MAHHITNHPLALPLLTTLIGTGGLTVGIYSFISPVAAARTYGIPVSDSRTTLFSPLASSSKPLEISATTSAAQNPTRRELSLVHALGIRNLTIGLTIIILTAYWHFDSAGVVTSPGERRVLQHALGIVILIGAMVPIVDAWVCLTHSRDVLMRRQKHKGKDDKKDLWLGHEWEKEAYETSRKAGTLHAARSLVWLAGGIWCLFE